MSEVKHQTELKAHTLFLFALMDSQVKGDGEAIKINLNGVRPHSN